MEPTTTTTSPASVPDSSSPLDTSPQPSQGQQTQTTALCRTDDGAVWDGTSLVIAQSFAPGNRNAAALVSKALGRADQRIRNVAGKTIDVVHFVAHLVQLPDEETGEYRTVRRVVFVLRDGTTVSTCSQPVVKMWVYLTSILGLGPYVPPARLVVTETPTEGGKSYCTIEMLEEDESHLAPPARATKKR